MEGITYKRRPTQTKIASNCRTIDYSYWQNVVQPPYGVTYTVVNIYLYIGK